MGSEIWVEFVFNAVPSKEEVEAIRLTGLRWYGKKYVDGRFSSNDEMIHGGAYNLLRNLLRKYGGTFGSIQLVDSQNNNTRRVY